MAIRLIMMMGLAGQAGRLRLGILDRVLGIVLEIVRVFNAPGAEAEEAEEKKK